MMASQMDPWHRFRTLKRIDVIGVSVFLLTFVLLGLGRVDMRSHAIYFVIFLWGWAIFTLVMIKLTREVRCPRCGQRFYVKDVFWQMATKCLHCGRQKYADLRPSGHGELEDFASTI
jgi:hypothetical protein